MQRLSNLKANYLSKKKTGLKGCSLLALKTFKTMKNEAQISDKKPINLKKQLLIELSVKARELKESKIKQATENNDVNALMYWQSRFINDIIAEWYREQSGATVFKTYKQWQELGQQVKKGSQSFVLWAKKEKVNKKDENGAPTDQVNYEFFPMAFLFSDLQVEPVKIMQEA